MPNIKTPNSSSPKTAEVEELIASFNNAEWRESLRLSIAMAERYPDYPFGWKALGSVMLTIGKHSESVLSLQKAIDLMPNDPEAFCILGKVFRSLGLLQKSVSSYRRALELKFDYVEAHNNLGNVLNDLGYLEDAESSYRQALVLCPDFAEARNNLGYVLYVQGRLKEAEISLRRALEVKPGFAEANNNLGNVLFALGRIPEAEENYRKAISILPNKTEYLRNLSMLKKFAKGDPDIELFERAFFDVTHPKMSRIHICFGMAKLYEDLGETKKVFPVLSEGNRLCKEVLNYNIEVDQRLFSRIRTAFAALPPQIEVSEDIKGIILIVGMPRSGTSLVEQILSSHQQVAGGGELNIMNHLAGEGLNEKNPVADTTWCKIASTYGRRLNQLRGSQPWVTDKMPTNFRWIGFLLWANPNIRVVHTKRDRIATCWSLYKQYFPANGLGFAYDLEDIGTFYRMYEDLMAFWHEKFPGRIYDLNYECLTENQEEETRKLLEYCGLPWDDRCLEFEKADRPVRTASAAQVRQKMYKGSSEAWRPYETYLGPLMKALGRS